MSSASHRSPWQPLEFRQLIDEAVKASKPTLRPAYWWIALPFAIVQMFVAVLQMRSMGGMMEDLTAGEIGGYFSQFAGLLGMSALAGLASGVTASVLLAIALDSVAQRPIRPMARWRFTLTPSVLATLIATFIAVVLGTLFCLLPGILATVLLAFVVPVMAEEGVRGFDALGRSVELALHNPQGRFVQRPAFKIFVLLIITYALSTVASLLVQIPFSIVQQVGILRQAADAGDLSSLYSGGWMWLSVPAAVLGSLVQTLVLFYFSHGVALLYFDGLRRWTGEDLVEGVDSLLRQRGLVVEQGPAS